MAIPKAVGPLNFAIHGTELEHFELMSEVLERDFNETSF